MESRPPAHLFGPQFPHVGMRIPSFPIRWMVKAQGRNSCPKPDSCVSSGKRSASESHERQSQAWAIWSSGGSAFLTLCRPSHSRKVQAISSTVRVFGFTRHPKCTEDRSSRELDKKTHCSLFLESERFWPGHGWGHLPCITLNQPGQKSRQL